MLAKPFRRAHDSREEIIGMPGKKKAGETRAAFRPDSSGNGDSSSPRGELANRAAEQRIQVK